MLALCGAAGALGAVFSAPFGGAIFAVEVPYRRDANMGFFWPALVSSFTGFGVGYAIVGRQQLLKAPIVGHLAVAGVGAGGRDRRGRVRLSAGCSPPCSTASTTRAPGVPRRGRADSEVVPDRHRRAAAAGLVMVAFPQVYGIGYQAIRDTASGRLFTGHTLAVAALLFAGMGVAKMVAASFTVGTGGVGGLLFPAMFTGAALGGARRPPSPSAPGRVSSPTTPPTC